MAPPGEHRPLHAVGSRDDRGAAGRCRDEIVAARTAGPHAVPPGRPELGRAGRRPDQPPVLRPVRPAADPAPDRGGAGRRGAVPDPGGRVPVLPARPRRGPPARTACSTRTTTRSPSRPYASRSPFEVWVVPRRHDADFARADRPRRRRHRGGAPPGPRPARRQPRRPALQPGPPQRAAERAGGRDLPLALGDPPPAARDRGPRAGHGPAGQPGVARRTRSRSCGPVAWTPGHRSTLGDDARDGSGVTRRGETPSQGLGSGEAPVGPTADPQPTERPWSSTRSKLAAAGPARRALDERRAGTATRRTASSRTCSPSTRTRSTRTSCACSGTRSWPPTSPRTRS